MNRTIFMFVLCAAALASAACGTVATPEWAAEAQNTRAALAVTSEYETSIAPTPIPPTATFTLVPPTATLTEVPATATPVPPTATPTEVPPTAAATATLAPTEVAAAAGGEIPDPASIGDVAAGQALFQSGGAAGVPCATCRSITPDEMVLVGPGQWNLALRAGSRVPGLDAVSYIHQSIVEPDAFHAPGFEAGGMPDIYEPTLSETDINNLIAYLLTLHD